MFDMMSRAAARLFLPFICSVLLLGTVEFHGVSADRGWSDHGKSSQVSAASAESAEVRTTAIRVAARALIKAAPAKGNSSRTVKAIRARVKHARKTSAKASVAFRARIKRSRTRSFASHVKKAKHVAAVKEKGRQRQQSLKRKTASKSQGPNPVAPASPAGGPLKLRPFGEKLNLNPFVSGLGEGNNNGVGARPPAEQLPDDGEVFFVTANAENATAGLVLSDLPSGSPPRVFIDYSIPGEWAQREGISAGDEILRINGQKPGSLGKEAFADMLQQRPLELEVVKMAYWKVGDEAKLIGLAEHEGQNEGKSVALVAYSNHEWEVELLETGEVLHVPVTSLAPLDSGDLRKKYGMPAVGTEGNLVRLRELMKEANSKGAGKAVTFAATMQEQGDTGIALSTTLWGKSSGGSLVIDSVEPNSWAANMGISKGAEIMSINFNSPEAIDSEEAFEDLLSTRPLSLLIREEGLSIAEVEEVKAQQSHAESQDRSGEEDKIEESRRNGIPFDPPAPDRVEARSEGFEIGLYLEEKVDEDSRKAEGEQKYRTYGLENPGAEGNMEKLRDNVWLFLREAVYIKTKWNYTQDTANIGEASYDELEQLLKGQEKDIAQIAEGDFSKAWDWATRGDKRRQHNYAKDWMKKLPLLLEAIEEDKRATKQIDYEESLLKQGDKTESAREDLRQDINLDVAMDEAQLRTLMEVEQLFLAEHAYLNQVNHNQGEHQLNQDAVESDVRTKYGLGPLGSEGNLQKLGKIEQALMKDNQEGVGDEADSQDEVPTEPSGFERKMVEKARKENLWLMRKQEAIAQMQKDIRKMLAEEDAFMKKTEHDQDEQAGAAGLQDEAPAPLPAAAHYPSSGKGQAEQEKASDEDSEEPQYGASNVSNLQDSDEGSEEAQYGAGNVSNHNHSGVPPMGPEGFPWLLKQPAENREDKSNSSDDAVPDVPPIVWNTTEAYQGNPGLRLNYSGLKDCGEHFKKVVGVASKGIGEATAAAIATVDNTNQLVSLQSGMLRNTGNYKRARNLFKENVQNRHRHIVEKTRRLLARGIPLGVVEDAHVQTRLSRAESEAERQAILGFGPHYVNGEPLTAHSHKMWWDELSEEQMAEWTALGWNEVSWNRNMTVPETSKTPWEDLSPEQRNSATRLGYTQGTWDASIFDPTPGVHQGFVNRVAVNQPRENNEPASDDTPASEVGSDSEVGSAIQEPETNAVISRNDGDVQMHATRTIPQGEELKLSANNGIPVDLNALHDSLQGSSGDEIEPPAGNDVGGDAAENEEGSAENEEAMPSEQVVETGQKLSDESIADEVLGDSPAPALHVGSAGHMQDVAETGEQLSQEPAGNLSASPAPARPEYGGLVNPFDGDGDFSDDVEDVVSPGTDGELDANKGGDQDEVGSPTSLARPGPTSASDNPPTSVEWDDTGLEKKEEEEKNQTAGERPPPNGGAHAEFDDEWDDEEPVSSPKAKKVREVRAILFSRIAAGLEVKQSLKTWERGLFSV